jgi:REP element-mobilizing transposase RayT
MPASANTPPPRKKPTEAPLDVPATLAGMPSINTGAHPGARASRPQHEASAGEMPALQRVGADPAPPGAVREAGETPALQAPAHRQWHCRGYLPHFDRPGLIQSITFRLNDSIPGTLLESWQGSIDREHRKRAQEFLDLGHGDCALRDPRIALLVNHALMHFDGARYHLLAWVIMPNHVHVLIETMEGHPLDKVIHSWKSFTSKEANKSLGRAGAFWYPDYFDRYIRDADHFEQAVAYIHENPVKAGLVSRSTDWPWSSAGARAARPQSHRRAGETPALPGLVREFPGAIEEAT